MKFNLKAALTGLAALALASSAQAEQEIIFGISATPGSLQQMTAAEFTKRANERLAGKATVKLFDSSQLGKDKDLMQKLKLGTVLNLLTKPRWCFGMLGTKNRTFGNIVGHAPGVDNMNSLSEWTQSQFDQSLDWSSIEWIKARWDRKLILKGINDVEDAKIAADIGADAIIVSNHGGRQLDGAAAPIDLLARIIDAVGDRIEVHMDSGIRTGQDVFKAIAMGAKSTYIGRAYIYGLGAMGEQGVTKALEIVRSELDVTMALCGETDINNVGRHNLLDFDERSNR